jgi:hypothetical protein
MPIIARPDMDAVLNADHFRFQCVVCKEVVPTKKMYITSVTGYERLCPVCYTELINWITEALNYVDY